jgi:Domain of unknown function (DUF4349)
VTMVDEQALAGLLQQVAQSIAIPAGAEERILAKALSVETDRATEADPSDPAVVPPSRLAAVVRRGGRTRALSVAAAVILVAGGIALSAVALKGSHGGTSSAASSATSASAAVGTGATGTHEAAGSAEVPYAPSKGAKTSSASTNGRNSTSAGSSAPATGSSLPQGLSQSAKVEATGSVDLTIPDGKLQSVLTTLTAMATADGGFVASSQAQMGAGGAGTTSSGTIVLQVPEPTFAGMVSQVQRVGHPTSVTTSSTDVTSQYVDLQSRITALQASRQQYLTIMTQANSIGDILAVQSQLETLQSQIEQLQGQLNVLTSQTTYGRLTVTLTEAGHHVTPPPIHLQSGISKAWSAGVGGFVSGVEWLIRIGGTVLFVLLALAVLAWGGRWAWRIGRRQMI